jgi:hypothetical protein
MLTPAADSTSALSIHAEEKIAERMHAGELRFSLRATPPDVVGFTIVRYNRQ